MLEGKRNITRETRPKVGKPKRCSDAIQDIKQSMYIKAYHAELKREVISHYSRGRNRCECCGESHIEFLTLDHVNGDGNKHRREIKRASGQPFYRWLKQNGFPNDPPLRVLCHNCNTAKGVYGKCPHDIEKQSK